MLSPLFQAVGLPAAANSKADKFESLVASKIRDGYISASGLGEKLKVPPDMRATRDYLLENGWKFRNGYFWNDESRNAQRLQAAVMARKKNAEEIKAKADVRVNQIIEDARRGNVEIPPGEIERFEALAKRDIERNKSALGIEFDWDDTIAENMREAINKDYQKNFAGFTEQQGEDIRQWVHNAYVNGKLTKKAAADYFARQYDISKERAKFWARQELSLFVSNLKTEQMNAAGYRYYIWNAVMDDRTRPDHYELDGSIQDTYNPPVVDKRTGRRGNPGIDFNCRCFAQFITEQEYNERMNYV